MILRVRRKLFKITTFPNNYVLEALLGARPTSDDVKNVWQSKANDYSIVHCAMLYGLESTSTTF